LGQHVRVFNMILRRNWLFP